ncbi:MAG: hypothetical protein MZU97_18935 [Bacillus subtilis]|nr:hypothetical protein [Bacillus subtilis]
MIRRVLAGDVRASGRRNPRLPVRHRPQRAPLRRRAESGNTCTSGELVVCDRYLFSSLAYQGMRQRPRAPGAPQSADSPCRPSWSTSSCPRISALTSISGTGRLRTSSSAGDFPLPEVSRAYEDVLDAVRRPGTGGSSASTDPGPFRISPGKYGMPSLPLVEGINNPGVRKGFAPGPLRNHGRPENQPILGSV